MPPNFQLKDGDQLYTLTEDEFSFFYLMWTAAQTGDYFAADEFDGDMDLGGFGSLCTAWPHGPTCQYEEVKGAIATHELGQPFYDGAQRPYSPRCADFTDQELQDPNLRMVCWPNRPILATQLSDNDVLDNDLDGDLSRVAEHSFTYAIRATATLFYVFCTYVVQPEGAASDGACEGSR
jgi:hypothetical protein